MKKMKRSSFSIGTIAVVVLLIAAGALADTTVLVSDTFNDSSLNTTRWQVDTGNPAAPGTVALNGTGALVLTVPTGPEHNAEYPNTAVRASQAAPNGDFTLEVKFNGGFPAASGVQGQGVFVWESATRWLRFDLYRNSGTPVGAVLPYASLETDTGTTVFFDGNSSPLSSPSAPWPDNGPMWVKVQRTGNNWVFSASDNGTAYTQITTFSQALTVARVGVQAINASPDGGVTPAPAFTSTVDFFYNAVRVAGNDAVSVDEAGTVTGNVLDNDSAGNYAVTVTKVADPAHASSFTLGANGAFSYTHDGSETTTDSFTYKWSDANGDSNTATVTITIAAINEPPTATNLTATVDEGGTVLITWVATDPEGLPMTASIVTPPAHGSAVVEGTALKYTHNGGETTSDSFTYKVSDGVNDSNVASVSITVNPLPETPDTVGLVDPATGKWYLRNAAGQVTEFFYGVPGDIPIVGDWNGDGVETPGAYRQSDGFVYLRNSNSTGPGDVRFYLGIAGDIPLAGDFDGDGKDTVSVYRPSEGRAYIKNSLGAADAFFVADYSFYFGNPGDKPFVGDFNGDGVETLGLHRETTGFVYFRNSNSQGNADSQFFFGEPNDRLVAGDWIGQAFDTVAIFRPTNSTFYFRFSNTQGFADATLPFGSSTFRPVAGKFGLG